MTQWFCAKGTDAHYMVMALLHFKLPKPARENGDFVDDDSSAYQIYAADLRGHSPHSLRAQIETQFREVPHLRHYQDSVLRIAVVDDQRSDELAIESAQNNIVLLEAERELPVHEAIGGFVEQLQSFSEPALDEPSNIQASGAGASSVQHSAIDDSPYAREPAYFDRQRYEAWLNRFDEPWNEKEDFDSET